MKRPFFILIATSLSISPVMPGTIALDRPVARSLTPDILYYSFDQLSDSVVFDESKNVGDGELQTGTYSLPVSVPGVNEGGKGFQQALQFSGGPKADGSLDRNPFVILASADHLNLDGRDFTLGVWVKIADSESTALEIISKGLSRSVQEKDAGYTLALEREDSGGNWRAIFETRDGFGNRTVEGTGFVLSLEPGKWFHIGLTYHHASRMAQIWFNGELTGEVEMATPIGQGSEMLVIGERRSSQYYSQFKGSLDDLFITEGAHEFRPVPSR